MLEISFSFISRKASKFGKFSLTNTAASAALNLQTVGALKVVNTGDAQPVSVVSTINQDGLKVKSEIK
jgi:hypothetical protein